MVTNDALINALRERGFHFKRQASRVVIYKKRGATDRITIKRSQSHSAQAVRPILRLAGMEDDEIERFVSTYAGCR